MIKPSKSITVQFEQTKIPLAGENSWLPKQVNPEKDNNTVMFSKDNVFVKIYVRIKDPVADELLHTTENLLLAISDRIVQ